MFAMPRAPFVAPMPNSGELAGMFWNDGVAVTVEGKMIELTEKPEIVDLIVRTIPVFMVDVAILRYRPVMILPNTPM